MSECQVSELWIYPLKGARGVSQGALELRPDGIVRDRELMLLKNGEPYTQKENARLATLTVELASAGGLQLSETAAGRFDHQIRSEGPDVATKLHFNEITTRDQGDEIAAWACEAMQDTELRVVSLPKPWDRWLPVPGFEAVDGKPQAQLYDVAPVLLNNQASLDDFNSRTEQPVPMDRFRANVIVTGGLAPYAENEVSSLRSPEFELVNVIGCERCVVTTTDQESGERPTKEPIQTLSKYRRIEEKYASGVVFGAYMRPSAAGTLRVGERLVYV